jgi:hypothetical protein
MDASFIAAVGGGFAMILSATFVFPRVIRKAYAIAPDRRLIEAKIRGQYGGRAAIVTEVLVIVAFIFSFSFAQERAALTAVYFFVLMACVACRTIFKEMRIVAETELEIREKKAEQV